MDKSPQADKTIYYLQQRSLNQTMTIGEKLKNAREAMGIDETSASDATHIRRENIIAFEEDRFDDIALANVYRIGFLRIYAKYLRLDAEKLVSEFKQLRGIKSVPGAKFTRQTTPPVRSLDAEDSLLGEPESDIYDMPMSGTTSSKNRKLFVVAAVVVVILLGLVLLLVKACSSSPAGDGSNVTPESAIEDPKENMAYKIELKSSVTQKITVWEKYRGWDTSKNEPLAGAKIVNEILQAGKAKTYEARGNLCIQESVAGALIVKHPTREAIEAAPAGKVLLLPSDAASVNTMTGKDQKLWLVEIWSK